MAFARIVQKSYNRPDSGDRKCSLFTRVITRVQVHRYLSSVLPLPEMDTRNADDGRLIRQSANTRNWEKAELTARDLEDAANPHKPRSRTRVRIADAIQCFRDDNLDI